MTRNLTHYAHAYAYAHAFHLAAQLWLGRFSLNSTQGEAHVTNKHAENLIRIVDEVQIIQPHRIRGFDEFNAQRIMLVSIKTVPEWISLKRNHFSCPLKATLDITKIIDNVEVTFRAQADGCAHGHFNELEVEILAASIEAEYFVFVSM